MAPAATGPACRRLAPVATPQRQQVVVQPVLAAKKGDKGGKGGKGAKKSALADLLKKKEEATGSAAATEGASSAVPADCVSPEGRMLAFTLADSYYRLTKKFLLEGVDFEKLPAALFRAPFALLAHNKFQEGVTDPIYIYGNRAALDLFEKSWDELLEMPSRLSAPVEDSAQTDRNGLLEQAAKAGHVSGYEAWRVSASGRRFKIKDVTLFNLMDRSGTKMGQAAVFSQYETEDGVVHTIKGSEPDAEEEAAAAGPSIPTPEEIEAAEAAVAEQAAHVRSLKEVQGLQNNDIPVQIAVMELKKRKEKLTSLQKALEDALAASKAAFDDDDE
ncbi:hypothetical protein HYH02_006854 [Chlamydomonas schloesseri]|uniref:MEKHLA domain-containing protein n=1 Tax=Chlamydomonas schloesseri TaxID=2026947 RepID=A0A835WIW5_9CHLO|nr:hypothetical protein HYH02_006854 [Chlamydomonas schloesseri]|eukprot:KAG2448270.1 hypothetical protein HYH02_006854 [Chlamydomonas schloesseri]